VTDIPLLLLPSIAAAEAFPSSGALRHVRARISPGSQRARRLGSGEMKSRFVPQERSGVSGGARPPPREKGQRTSGAGSWRTSAMSLEARSLATTVPVLLCPRRRRFPRSQGWPLCKPNRHGSRHNCCRGVEHSDRSPGAPRVNEQAAAFPDFFGVWRSPQACGASGCCSRKAVGQSALVGTMFVACGA